MTEYTLAENWMDHLWCSNRNVQQSSEPVTGHDSYEEHSWNSLLRSSWRSPTPWSPSTSQGIRSSTESSNNIRHFSAYNSLPEVDFTHDVQNVNCVNLAASIGQSQGMLHQVLFNQSPTNLTSGGSMPPILNRDNLTVVSVNFIKILTKLFPFVENLILYFQNEVQFDPFHSLSSIWSPKTQNSWNSEN